MTNVPRPSTIRVFLADGPPEGLWIMGRTANGRTEWKTENGRMLKELEDAEARSEQSA